MEGMRATGVRLWVRMRALQPRWILLVAWLVTIAYSYPGYLNWDSGVQLFALRSGGLDDWHPPMMATYWRWIEYFVHGPLGMLVLQTYLFLWGLCAVLRQRFSPRLAALLASGLLLFPPILTPMAAVWKDAQMAGFLMAGVALGLRRRWSSRGAGLLLLVFACGVRDNGAAALPPLCLLLVASWQAVERRVAIVAISACLFAAVTFTATTVNRGLTDHRAFAWYRSVAIHDIAGSICREDHMSDAQVRQLLEGIKLHETSDLQAVFCSKYDSRGWFELTYDGPGTGLFVVPPQKAERLARRHAWSRIVQEHTGAYLAHRWAVMRGILGLTSDPIWEPVCQTIGASSEHLARVSHNGSLSWFQIKLGTFFRETLATTLLFRPWAYLAIGLVMLVYAVGKRDGWLCFVLGSGILYEFSFFVGAAAPDYRYSHWMITCVCVATLTIFIERLRGYRSAQRADAGVSGVGV